jgi:hypothetical protein
LCGRGLNPRCRLGTLKLLTIIPSLFQILLPHFVTGVFPGLPAVFVVPNSLMGLPHRWEIQANNILDNVSYDELLSAATAHRPGVSVAAVEVIKPWITYGGSNVIVPIKFGDGVIWAARLTTQEWIPLLQASFVALDYLQTYCQDVLAPRLMGMCLSNNSVGAPYIMMDWIPGHELDGWSAEFPPKGCRQRLLKGLAASLLALWYRSQRPAKSPTSNSVC